MNRTTRLARAVASFAAAAGLALVPGALAPASAHAATGCATAWGSTDREVAPTDLRNGGAVVGQRVGHHACYDRLVVDLDGPATLVQARYRPGPGGSTVLEVRTRHDSMTSPVGYPPPPVPTTSTGLATIRATGAPTVGRTFSAVAVTTRARLPFRVLALPGPGAHSRIVVDVAHRW